jgi:hypothetical protein
MSRGAAALLALWLTACGGDPSSDAPPRPSTRGAFRSQIEPSPAGATQPPPTPANPEAQSPPPASDIAHPAVAPAPDQDKPEPRDYSAELLDALGSPTDCLKAQSAAEAPSQIDVGLEAHVVKIGMVTRAYVRSSQLNREELACIQRRLASLRFIGPVEGAPRIVSATLSLKLAKSEKANAEPAPSPAANPGY